LKREGFFKKRERAARVKGQSFSSKNKEEREREESDSRSFLSRANILFWKKQKRRNPSLFRSFSLSLLERDRE